MSRAVKCLLIICIVIVLTVITQIGGIVFLVSWLLVTFLHKRILQQWSCKYVLAIMFSGVYLLSTFAIVPLLAKPLGRVALPIWSTNKIHLEPTTFATVLLNRHYVTPELRETLLKVSKGFNLRYSGLTVRYLDACFPFFDGFPLLPHLSHSDGKKVDLAFVYKNRFGEYNKGNPTLLGYGHVTPPKSRELDQPKVCAKKGYWQYSLLTSFVWFDKSDFVFDKVANRDLLNIIVHHAKVRKVFLEPHLKARLNLQQKSKIRFHGCRAVRHDDHIHLQL